MERTLASTLLHTVRIRLTEDFPGQIASCLGALGDEQLWWRPNERSNSVANIVLHLCGSNHYYLEHVIAGQELNRDRDLEFSARGSRTKDQLLSQWRESVQRTAGVLGSLEPSRMDEPTDRTGKPTTIAQILLHVSHHNATHMGQIVWIAKMLNADAVDDLWMKMRMK